MVSTKMQLLWLLTVVVFTRTATVMGAEQEDQRTGGEGVKPFRYVVQTGDTHSGLAAKWGIPAKMIAPAGRTLKAGDELVIPLRARVRIGPRDSLWKVGRRYNIRMETIAKFNGIRPPKYVVRPGQIVLIPEVPRQRRKESKEFREKTS